MTFRPTRAHTQPARAVTSPAARHIVVNDLAAVPPPYVPPEAYADQNDGTLYFSHWRDGLTIYQARWENFYFGSYKDTVQYQIWLGDSPKDNPGPEDPGQWWNVGESIDVDAQTTWPLEVPVPVALLNAEGPMAIRAQVTTWNSGIGITQWVMFRLDRTPPFFQQNPPAMMVTPNPVTDAAFENGGHVTAQIPRYGSSGYESGDSVSIYWSRLDDWPTDTDPIVSNVAIPDTGVIAVDLPDDVIQREQGGAVWVSYRLHDKAGNRSESSEPQRVMVALGPIASGMQPPVIPQASPYPDNPLELTDAIEGVHVEIPPFNDVLAGDSIVLYWGGQPAHLITPSVWPFPASSLPILVPNPLMLADYGNSMSAKDTVVGYEVVRSGMAMAPRQDTTISVDFHVEGPVDPVPGWPDPVNEALGIPALVPSNASGSDNALTPVDRGQPASIRVWVHPDIVPGQIMRFFWDDLFITEHVVETHDLDTDIFIEVPWANILMRGNGVWQLYYQLRTGTQHNFWQSPSQSVDISAVALPRLEFSQLVGGMLNCGAVEQVEMEVTPGQPEIVAVVQVAVPDLSRYLSEGDTVTLDWYALMTDSGNDEAPGKLSQDIVLDKEHPAHGFIWNIPYEQHFLPIYEAGQQLVPAKPFGRGFLSARFTAFGKAWETDASEAFVVMFEFGGFACEIGSLNSSV